MKGYPVVKEKDIAGFLPEADTQIFSLCRFFQEVQGFALVIRQAGAVRVGISVIYQYAQEASCEMPIAKGEDGLFAVGQGVSRIHHMSLVGKGFHQNFQQVGSFVSDHFVKCRAA